MGREHLVGPVSGQPAGRTAGRAVRTAPEQLVRGGAFLRDVLGPA
jgi:hypothetical protein